MRLASAMPLAIIVISNIVLSACATSGEGLFSEPPLSPVGTGVVSMFSADNPGHIEELRAAMRPAIGQALPDLFRDRRVGRRGDIVTINIAVNDKATFGNATDRSQSSNNSLVGDMSLHFGANTNPTNISADVSSKAATQGKGNIDRSEQIQISVAAMVTEVLPNGYLVLSGSQEVRVNFELRRVSVAGIVRPSDISQNNIVSYDRLAEARISYGGEGKISELQRPAWGQQLYERYRPF